MVEDFNSQAFKRIRIERSGCKDIGGEDEYCYWYNSSCFHDINNRCFRVRPRTKEEFTEWMGDLCSDCNEPVCNDCDMYKNHFFDAIDDLSLHLQKPKRRTFFFI